MIRAPGGVNDEETIQLDVVRIRAVSLAPVQADDAIEFESLTDSQPERHRSFYHAPNQEPAGNFLLVEMTYVKPRSEGLFELRTKYAYRGIAEFAP